MRIKSREEFLEYLRQHGFKVKKVELPISHNEDICESCFLTGGCSDWIAGLCRKWLLVNEVLE